MTGPNTLPGTSLAMASTCRLRSFTDRISTLVGTMESSVAMTRSPESGSIGNGWAAAQASLLPPSLQPVVCILRTRMATFSLFELAPNTNCLPPIP